MSAAPSPRAAACAALSAALAACSGTPRAEIEAETAPAWRELFDGHSLQDWRATGFGGDGEVRVEDGRIVLDYGSPLTGLTWIGGALPRQDYELEVVAARIEGDDFFCGLTFPVGDAHCTLVLGGWGGAVTGLSCLDDADASENPTRRVVLYETGREYTARVRVDGDRVVAWLDGEVIADVRRGDTRFSLRPEVQASTPLGIAAFSTVAAIKTLRVRPIAARARPGA